MLSIETLKTTISSKQIEVPDTPFYLDRKVKEQLMQAKKKVSSRNQDRVYLLTGREGCLTGDTIIQVNRNKDSWKKRLDWIYNQMNGNPDGVVMKTKNWDLSRPTFVRSYNGKEIKLHKIKGATYSGIKMVYLLKLQNGLSIKGTANHNIMTDKGWVQLINLDSKSRVMCDTLHAEENHKRKIKLYDIQLHTYYHPYTKNNRVEVHKLIYESRMNDMSFLEYLDILLNDEERAKQLKYIDPDKFHIHHVDGCHYNNSIDNLVLLTREEHLKHHAENSYTNFSQGIPKFSAVESITPIGEEKTYDLICEEPHHNFVANGIVVHNSGKSTLAQQLAWFCDDTIGIDDIVFNADAFEKRIREVPRHKAVIFDEAFNGLSSKAALSKENKRLVQLLMECRARNLYIFIVCPTFLWI